MATIIGSNWQWFGGSGSPVQTRKYNFPVRPTVARAFLHGVAGPGRQSTGILGYAGLDEHGRHFSTGFPIGSWWAWPPIVNGNLDSVTFALSTDANQQGWVLAVTDTWG